MPPTSYGVVRRRAEAASDRCRQLVRRRRDRCAFRGFGRQCLTRPNDLSGGGVVGLAVARELAVRGERVVLLEKNDTLVAEASRYARRFVRPTDGRTVDASTCSRKRCSGNSGLGATGYDAPEGSLEQRLLRRSIQRHPNLYVCAKWRVDAARSRQQRRQVSLVWAKLRPRQQERRAGRRVDRRAARKASGDSAREPPRRRF